MRRLARGQRCRWTLDLTDLHEDVARQPPIRLIRAVEARHRQRAPQLGQQTVAGLEVRVEA
jgi:hypothetical protein